MYGADNRMSNQVGWCIPFECTGHPRAVRPTKTNDQTPGNHDRQINIWFALPVNQLACWLRLDT